MFVRNVLVYNGPALDAILEHARGLLRPEGHLLCVEPDITGLRFPEWAAAEQELEQRWMQMMRSMGNDPGPRRRRQARRPADLDGRVHPRPRRTPGRPAWTARQMMVNTRLATTADIAPPSMQLLVGAQCLFQPKITRAPSRQSAACRENHPVVSTLWRRRPSRNRIMAACLGSGRRALLSARYQASS